MAGAVAGGDARGTGVELVAVIVTPGSAAPVSSVMLPEMDPVLPLRECRDGASATSSASVKVKRICFACVIFWTPFLNRLDASRIP